MSCANDKTALNILKADRNTMYFKEFYIDKEDKNDTLISIAMPLDSGVFHYKIREDIPIHFSIIRKRVGDMINCSVVYEWDERDKVVKNFSYQGHDQIDNLTKPYSGGLRISRNANFLVSDGVIKLLSSDLSSEAPEVTRGLGKKLKEFTGQDMMYSSYIVDSDSIYIVSFDQFRKN